MVSWLQHAEQKVYEIAFTHRSHIVHTSYTLHITNTILNSFFICTKKCVKTENWTHHCRICKINGHVIRLTFTQSPHLPSVLIIYIKKTQFWAHAQLCIVCQRSIHLVCSIVPWHAIREQGFRVVFTNAGFLHVITYFGLFRIILDHFEPIWTISNHFDPFKPFWMVDGSFSKQRVANGIDWFCNLEASPARQPPARSACPERRVSAVFGTLSTYPFLPLQSKMRNGPWPNVTGTS